ncbi:MAG: M18 family aminopeptidase [Mollicutes bacterium]|nr:M18 family aminopeptidase [Mollicutes bacterium]
MEKRFIEFLNKSHTTYQAITEAKKILLDNNFIELDLINPWNLKKGQNYFIIKNDASIIAFKLGKTLNNPSIQVVASHNDSPMLKIKPNGVIYQNGYTKLNTEIYGGAIYSTFMDRPLGIAGRVIIKENETIISKNITLDTTVIIPNLAIHLNREINTNHTINAQTDMSAILSLGETTINDLIEKELGNVEVLDYDLFLYNKEEARIVGYNNEFISGPRLDNLECYYTSLEALIEGDNSENINVWAGFNNEEVGSGSNNGAGSTFLIDVINKVLTDLKLDDNRLEIFNRSMTISADNAHAIHPNHPEKSDPTNNVKLNNGIVIKYNSGLSYTSDAVSAGVFKSICNEENVPYQVYTNRSDLRGGGTLGSILLHTFSVTSVDIGLAQLAMHSAYETAGTKDLEMMKKVLKSFYSRHLNYQNTQTLTIK